MAKNADKNIRTQKDPAVTARLEDLAFLAAGGMDPMDAWAEMENYSYADD